MQTANKQKIVEQQLFSIICRILIHLFLLHTSRIHSSASIFNLSSLSFNICWQERGKERLLYHLFQVTFSIDHLLRSLSERSYWNILFHLSTTLCNFKQLAGTVRYLNVRFRLYIQHQLFGGFCISNTFYAFILFI